MTGQRNKPKCQRCPRGFNTMTKLFIYDSRSRHHIGWICKNCKEVHLTIVGN